MGGTLIMQILAAPSAGEAENEVKNLIKVSPEIYAMSVS
jgi:hypothetical protein